MQAGGAPLYMLDTAAARSSNGPIAPSGSDASSTCRRGAFEKREPPGQRRLARLALPRPGCLVFGLQGSKPGKRKARANPTCSQAVLRADR